MNGDVTVREMMRREYVGVSEGDSLQETTGLMLEEDAEAAVVLRGSEPVGMVTRRDVLESAVEHSDLAAANVSDAMRTDLPTISPEESLSAATDYISGNDARHLLVMESGELVGVFSERDVVAASTLDHGVEDRSQPQAEATTTEAVTATAGAPAADQEYSNQGICEICGSLTRDLSTFNGQLVCSDCKNI